MACVMFQTHGLGLQVPSPLVGFVVLWEWQRTQHAIIFDMHKPPDAIRFVIEMVFILIEQP